MKCSGNYHVQTNDMKIEMQWGQILDYQGRDIYNEYWKIYQSYH